MGAETSPSIRWQALTFARGYGQARGRVAKLVRAKWVGPACLGCRIDHTLSPGALADHSVAECGEGKVVARLAFASFCQGRDK